MEVYLGPLLTASAEKSGGRVTGLWRNSGASHLPVEEREGMSMHGYQGLSAGPAWELGQLASLTRQISKSSRALRAISADLICQGKNHKLDGIDSRWNLHRGCEHEWQITLVTSLSRPNFYINCLYTHTHKHTQNQWLSPALLPWREPHTAVSETPGKWKPLVLLLPRAQ